MEGMDNSDKKTCKAEIQLMKFLSHPNIIGYKVFYLFIYIGKFFNKRWKLFVYMHDIL